MPTHMARAPSRYRSAPALWRLGDLARVAALLGSGGGCVNFRVGPLSDLDAHRSEVAARDDAGGTDSGLDGSNADDTVAPIDLATAETLSPDLGINTDNPAIIDEMMDHDTEASHDAVDQRDILRSDNNHFTCRVARLAPPTFQPVSASRNRALDTPRGVAHGHQASQSMNPVAWAA